MKLLRRTRELSDEVDGSASTNGLGRCAKHSAEVGVARCSTCHEVFCAECIVMPFGPSKPLCVSCALVAAGLRRSRPHAARF